MALTARTLLKAGIITDRMRATYGAHVDVAELCGERGSMIDDDIADEGIRYLMSLNGGKRLMTPTALAAE